MKKSFAIALFLAAGYIAVAQCDKKLIITSSKTEYLRADSSVERTALEKTIFEFDGKSLIVTDCTKNVKITGTITSYACDWSVPFKKGKLLLTATLTDERKTVNLRITVVGNGEKLTCYTKVLELPNHLAHVILDKFEENL